MQAYIDDDLTRFMLANLELLQMEFERSRTLAKGDGRYLVVVELASIDRAARPPYLIHSSGLSELQQADMPTEHEQTHFPLLFIMPKPRMPEKLMAEDRAGLPPKHAWRLGPIS